MADSGNHCCGGNRKIDPLFWGASAGVVLLFFLHLLGGDAPAVLPWAAALAAAVFEIVGVVWWGLALGVVAVGLLSQAPREFVIAALGRGGGIGGPRAAEKP